MSSYASSTSASASSFSYDFAGDDVAANNGAKTVSKEGHVLFHVSDVRSSKLKEMLTVEGDENRDGNVSEIELMHAFERELAAAQKVKRLTRVIGVFVAVSLVLLMCVFGLSVAAAYLAKDSSVSNSNNARAPSVLVSGNSGEAPDSSTTVRTGTVKDVITVAPNSFVPAPAPTSRSAGVWNRDGPDYEHELERFVGVRRAMMEAAGAPAASIRAVDMAAVTSVCESHVGSATANTNVTYYVGSLRVPTAQDQVLMSAWATIGSATATFERGAGSFVSAEVVPHSREVSTVLPGMTILDGTVEGAYWRVCCPNLDDPNEVCAFAELALANGPSYPTRSMPHHLRHRSQDDCLAWVDDHAELTHHHVECHPTPSGYDDLGPFFAPRPARWRGGDAPVQQPRAALPQSSSRHAVLRAAHPVSVRVYKKTNIALPDSKVVWATQDATGKVNGWSQWFGADIGNTRVACLAGVSDAMATCYLAREGQGSAGNEEIEDVNGTRRKLKCQKPAILGGFFTLNSCEIFTEKCFPASARVRMADGTTKAIADLAIGELLATRDPLTGALTTTPFIAFVESDPAAVYEAVVATLASGAVLEASPNHYVPFSRDGGATWTTEAIAKVAVGDVLRTADGKIAAVVDLDSRPVVGAYAPATMATTLIVDDVLVSHWADADSTIVDRITAGLAWLLGTSLASAELIIRAVYFAPYQIAYTLLPSSAWNALFDVEGGGRFVNAHMALLRALPTSIPFF